MINKKNKKNNNKKKQKNNNKNKEKIQRNNIQSTVPSQVHPLRPHGRPSPQSAKHPLPLG